MADIYRGIGVVGRDLPFYLTNYLRIFKYQSSYGGICGHLLYSLFLKMSLG